MVRCSGTEADGVAFLMRSGDIITQKSILHTLKYRTNACPHFHGWGRCRQMITHTGNCQPRDWQVFKMTPNYDFPELIIIQIHAHTTKRLASVSLRLKCSIDAVPSPRMEINWSARSICGELGCPENRQCRQVSRFDLQVHCLAWFCALATNKVPKPTAVNCKPTATKEIR